MKKEINFLKLAIFLMVTLVFTDVNSQPVKRNIRTKEYAELQKKLATGWNSWYNNNILSSTLLPEGFAINLCLSMPNGDGLSVIRENFKVSKQAGRKEKVILGLRSDDGYYTSLTYTNESTKFDVQTASEQNEIYILITPDLSAGQSKFDLLIEPSILWNRNGFIGKEGNKLVGKFENKTITVSSTEKSIENEYLFAYVPNYIFKLDKEIAIYTGKEKTKEEIKQIIEIHKQKQIKRAEQYGELSETFKAMQTILAWNTIYEPQNRRVISPVSRFWNSNSGGYVLFDWDTYFASFMFSFFNKELAYANAIEITKAITPDGFIPNYESPFGSSSWDRSQPPIGSLVINEIYKKYKEKWFLDETYDELLSWNRWWIKNRDVNGYLAWGSNNVSDTLSTSEKFNMQAAMYESGLDNSPMYDSIPFNKNTSCMDLADVGLMSFYISDCNELADISDVLGKKAEATEISERAAKYSKKLKTLWDEDKGIFLNKRLDNGKKSYHLSPTNFYPMLAKVCTQKQAERMMKEHYFNEKEFYGEYVIPSIARNDAGFKDNSYWRGRIWAPMNFLVYLGMRNYNVSEAKADLKNKSLNLLMKSWKANGSIFENYNSVTGEGDDVGNADSFYHWGALNGFISLMEQR